MWRLQINGGSAYNLTGIAGAADLVAFAHGALFLPAISTLQAAIGRGHINNMPGLTAQTLRHYPPQSIAMHKGHLDQTRKNQQSTKNKKPVATDEHPNSNTPNIRAHTCFVAFYKPTGKFYTDQTGQFPVVSAQGNQYVMILYNVDSNAILTKPYATKLATSF